MAQFNLTLDSEVLKGLCTADCKDEAFAGLVSAILNQVLSAQASEQIGAELYECSEDRRTYRNGYRERELYTRVGKLDLMVPRLRNGEYSTDLFQRFQRSEQSLYRLMCALLMEIHEEWQTGRVYLNLTGYLAQKTETANTQGELPAAS